MARIACCGALRWQAPLFVSRWQEVTSYVSLRPADRWPMFAHSTEAAIPWKPLWLTATRTCLLSPTITVFSRVIAPVIVWALNLLALQFLWKWPNSPQLKHQAFWFLIFLAVVHPMILTIYSWEPAPILSLIRSSTGGSSCFQWSDCSLTFSVCIFKCQYFYQWLSGFCGLLSICRWGQIQDKVRACARAVEKEGGLRILETEREGRRCEEEEERRWNL